MNLIWSSTLSSLSSDSVISPLVFQLVDVTQFHLIFELFSLIKVTNSDLNVLKGVEKLLAISNVAFKKRCPLAAWSLKIFGLKFEKLLI